MNVESMDAVSRYPREILELNTQYGKVAESISAVKDDFTLPRRSRRPRRERETLDYLQAARRFIRAAGHRVGEGDEHELAALLALQTDLNEALQTAVDGQRAHHKSWAMIAWATGTSREAAYQRWGKR